MNNVFVSSCNQVVCLDDAVKIVLEVFIILIISILLIRIITKKRRMSNVLIMICALIIQIIVAYHVDPIFTFFYGYIEEFNVMLIVNYIVFSFSFFNANRKSTLKEILNNTEYKTNCILLLIYELMFMFRIADMDYSIGNDILALYVLIVIRINSYIYLHSITQKVEENLPRWITQFYDAYELVMQQEDKGLFVRFYILCFKIGFFVKNHKILVTVVWCILLGPYMLITVELFRIANSFRKVLKKIYLYNYNVWLAISTFTISVISSVLLYETIERFKILIGML